MRRIPLLLLGLALASCTGSTEDPIRALLALASNSAVGSTYQIVFYATSTLQPGDFSTPPQVGSWAFEEPLVDIHYQRNLTDPTNNKLWVLSKTRLRRYSTTGLTSTNVGSPTPDGFDQALGVDCSRGYLRPGGNQLLVVCPRLDTSTSPPSESLTELPTAWLISDINNPTLDPAAPLTLTGFGGLDKIPVRLTLTGTNQIIYLTPGFIGTGTNISDTTTQRSLRSLSTPPSLDAVPRELTAVTETSNVIRVYGLMSSASNNETYGLIWDLSSNPVPFKDTAIKATQIAPGAPPVMFFGRGLGRLESGAIQLPPASLGLLSPEFSAGVVGLDQFFYVAQKDSSILWVLDLFGPTKDLTTSGIRPINLDTTGQLRGVSLAFIPVE